MAFSDSTPRTVLQGIAPAQVTLAGAVYAGDAITYNSGWKRAAIDTATEVLVAGENGASGDVITAYHAAVLGGSSGGTAGAAVMLAASGAYSEEATGQQVGVALSATEIYVGPLNTPATVSG